MKILVIQHSAGDPPGAAEPILLQQGHTLEFVRIDQQDPIPDSVDADALMTFGAALSLAGETRPDWVTAERDLIRQYVDQGKHVLGICFGSQMLAWATGGSVRRNQTPECGWHTIRRTDSIFPSPAIDAIPSEMKVLQWHQDTFELPSQATHLFESDACTHQGFAINDRVFGFQFHLEADERQIKVFLAASKLHKQTGPHIQNEDEIRAGIDLYLGRQTEVLQAFLTHWLD